MIEVVIQSSRDEVEVAPIYLPVLSSRPSAPSSNLSSDFVSPPVHLVPTERYYLRPAGTYCPCRLYPVSIQRR